MTSSCKQENATLRKINHANAKPLKPTKSFKLQIYYKNKKMKHPLLKNRVDEREESCVFYQYNCEKVPCIETKTLYIGQRASKIKERMK